jgi:hypothetical protein
MNPVSFFKVHMFIPFSSVVSVRIILKWLAVKEIRWNGVD